MGIIALFICTGIAPSVAVDSIKQLSMPIFNGKTLYVGGTGPNNYTSIQDAINDSSNGDIVYVYNGTYRESIQVNVINLKIIGEGRDVTFIDASYTGRAIKILKSFIVIKGFTIKAINYGVYIDRDIESITISDNNLSVNYSGINSDYNGYSKYNIFQNNIFYSSSIGIFIKGTFGSGFNIIRNNTFYDNYNGIHYQGENNDIYNNTFLNCRYSGICLNGGKANVKYNIFIGNGIAIDVFKTQWWGSENRFIGNHFENNNKGIVLKYARNNDISNNYFFSNKYGCIFYDNCDQNIISDNYFSNDGILIRSSYQNTFYNNLVNGKPLVYLSGESDRSIFADVGQIILVNCKNITIHNLNVSKTAAGIQAISSSNCEFKDNKLSNNNAFGIYVTGSYNEIYRNDITNNQYGLYWHGVSNIVKENNFIGNIVDARFSINPGKIFTSRWISNYWDNWIGVKIKLPIFQRLPKKISGEKEFKFYNPFIEEEDIESFRWIGIDWHPALKPYDIEVVI